MSVNNNIPSSSVQNTASAAISSTGSIGAQAVKQAQGVDAIVAGAKGAQSSSGNILQAAAEHL